MSRKELAIPPLIAFVDAAQEVWGVAVGSGGSASAAMGLFSSPGDVSFAPVALDAEDAAAGWTLKSESGTLAIPAAEPRAATAEAGHDLAISRITGTVRLPDGRERALDGGCVRHDGLPQGRIDSIRLVAGWFAPEQAIALLSVRPAGARGQERDTVSVAHLGEREGLQVFDPRLSSTYNGDGTLRRVGLEVWLGESEDGEQHPLRMAGETTGTTADMRGPDVHVQAQPVLCHSRGEDGSGIYVLIRGL